MKQTVLIIEDNEQNMYLMNFILEKNDFKVLKAMDGKEGIDLACREKPDLVLLDIQLPRMDGYEVARRLRQTEEMKSVPIIAVTSYAMVGDREKAIEAGCTGYIEKPINPSTFIDEVKNFI
ncbi:MAG: response regulator [Desulfobacteraceae bacterium]|jgi:two-component system cell cycle response regulator DivK